MRLGEVVVSNELKKKVGQGAHLVEARLRRRRGRGCPAVTGVALFRDSPPPPQCHEWPAPRHLR